MGDDKRASNGLSRRHLLIFGAIVPAMVTASSFGRAQSWYTPRRGSEERKAILDAFRPAIEAEMRGPVEFVIDDFRVQDGWAFVVADPQRPGGTPIDPAKTGHAEDIDFMDGLRVYALCRFVGGRWHLIDHVTGPTDVAYDYWSTIYGAPRIIFGFET